MKNNQDPDYSQLKDRLKKAEETIRAIRSGQIDTILGEKENLVVRLEKAEAREQHIKKILQALRHIDRSIVKAKNSLQMIEEICQTLTENREYNNTWIALFDEEGKFQLSAESGLGKNFEKLKEVLKNGKFTKCIEKACDTSGVQIISDPAEQCSDCPLLDQYEGSSAMSCRLEHNDRIYGVITASTPKNFATNKEEQEIFRELAKDIAFGLYNLEITEKEKQANAALASSEEKYRTLFETMKEGVVYQDAKGKIISANPAAERILGLSFAQMQGRESIDPRWRSIHEDGSDFPGEQHPAMVSLTTGKPVKNEIMGIYHPKIKEHVWISINSTPLFRKGRKKPFQVYTTFRDITQKKKVEEALKNSEENYRKTLDNMMEGCQIIGHDWRYKYLNKAAVKDSRKSRKELIDHTMMEAYPGIEKTEMFAYLEKCMTKRKQYSIENEFTYPDGTKRWFDLRMQPVPEGIFVLSIDITGKKQAEENILHLNSLLRAISNINQLIIKENDIPSLMKRACKILTEARTYHGCCISLLDEANGHIRPFTQTGAHKSKKDWKLIPEEKAEAPDCIKAALKAGKLVINKTSECTYCKFVDKQSNSICITSPMLREGKTVGFLQVGTRSKQKIGKQEKALIKEVTDDLAYAREKIISEQKLHKFELQLHNLMNNLPGMAYRCENDKDWTMKFVSNGAFDLTGYRSEALIDNTQISYNEIIHEDDRQRVWDTIQRSIPRKQYFELEYRIITKNNKVKWVWERGIALSRKGEKDTALEGFITDITDRKKAEEELEMIFRMSLDLICIADIETATFTKVNPAFTEILGYSEAELLGKPFIEFVHPDDVQTTNEIVENSLKAGKKVINFENRYKTKQGEYRWLDWVSHPVPEKGLTYAIAHDITERKEAQEQIEKLSRFPSENPNPVMRIDINGIVQFSNKAARPISEHMKGKTQDKISQDWHHEIEEIYAKNKIVEKTESIAGKIFQIGFVPITHKRYVNLYARDITEQAKAQRKLQENEQLLSNVFESMSEGIIILDKNFRYISWNNGMENISGESRQAVIGEIPWEKFSFLAKSKVEQAMKDAMKGNPSINIELEYTLNSDKVGWTSESYFPLRDEKGNIDGVVGVVEDITERKKALKSLQESKAKYHLLISNLNEGLMQVDNDDRILFVNRKLCEMFGYTKEELIGKIGYKTLILAEDRNIVKEKNISRSKIPTEQYEVRGKRKNGEIIWLNISGSAVTDEAGNTIGSVGLLSDITKRKNIQDELKESEKRLKEAEHVGKIGHVDWSVAEGKAYWSDEVFNIYDRAPKLGVPSYEEIMALHQPEDARKLEKVVKNALEKGEDYALDLVIKSKNNNKKYVHAIGYPIKDKAGKVTNIRGIIQDITERKAAEKELEKSEERFRKLIENSNDIFVVLNEKGEETFVSDSVEKITGIPAREYIGTLGFSHIHPDDRDRIIASFKQIIKSPRKLLKAQYRHKHKNGDWIYLEALGVNYLHEPAIRGIVLNIRDITERIKNEKLLKENQDYLQTIFDSVNDAIFIEDAKTGAIVDVNERMCEIYGYTQEEALNTPIGELSKGEPPYSEEDALKWLKKARKEGPQTFEWISKRKDGTEFWTEINARFVKINNQDRFIVVVRDISNRKQAEQAIKESEAELREAQRMANIGSCLFNPHTGRVYLSDELYNIIGIEKTADALKMENHEKYYTPESWQKFTREVEKALKTGEFNEIELEIIREDENNRIVSASAETITDETGKVIEFRGTLQDITERKHSERALEISEDRLSKIMIAANDGMWDWNLETNKVYFDPRYYEMAGYEIDEFPHELEEFFKRVHPEDRDYVQQEADKHLKGEIDRFKVEFRFRKKDGSWLWIMGKGVIVERDETGKPTRFVGTHTDISDRKATEQKIEQYRDHLEELVEERTEELKRKNEELERYNKLFIGREYRIKELKDKVKELEEKLEKDSS